MNRTLRHALLLGLAATFAAAPALAQKKTDAATFATVNGKAIPKSRADALIAGQAAQGQPDSPELRKAVTEELVRREVLTQEALKKGFDKKPEVQGQMDLARQGVLIGAYLNDYVKSHPVTDEQIKKEYDEIKGKLGNKEYKARHVLLETEAAAKAVIEKLKKGEKFDDLAKDSKDRGGDLGWANPASFVPAFSAAMTKLEKGKFTEAPVKSDFGWHVIQLDDVRETKAPTFEEVKPNLTQRAQGLLVEKHLAELRAKAAVK